MSSSDLKGDAMALFVEHQRTILAVLGAAIGLLLLLSFFGGVRVLGGLFFVGYALLWLAVVAFVLWLFYRLVVAVERIAGAQERIASVQFKAELEENADGEGGSDDTGTQTTFGDRTEDETTTGASDESTDDES